MIRQPPSFEVYKITKIVPYGVGMIFVHNHASDQNCNVMPLKHFHSNKYLHNSHQYINMDYIIKFLCLIEVANRADPRHVGAP
jgi:hypothetical protein